MEKIKKILEAISVGQYTPQLYIKGKQYHGSVYGGLFMIAYQIFFLTATIFILVELCSMKYFNLQSESFNFGNQYRCQDDSNCMSITLDEYFKGFDNYYLFIKISDSEHLLGCKNINMTATLDLLMVSARAEDTYPISLTTKLEDRILGDEKGCSLMFNRSFIHIQNQLRDKSDEVYIDDPDHDIMEYLANITVNGLNQNSSAKLIYNRNKFLYIYMLLVCTADLVVEIHLQHEQLDYANSDKHAAPFAAIGPRSLQEKKLIVLAVDSLIYTFEKRWYPTFYLAIWPLQEEEFLPTHHATISVISYGFVSPQQSGGELCCFN